MSPTSGGEEAGPETEDSILALMKMGEAHNLELKETFRVNAHTGECDARMETETARAVAVLINTDGGRVIIGVHDSG